MNNNILYATKNLHLVCKFFGTTSYSIRKTLDHTNLKIVKKEKTLINIQTTVVFLLSILSIIKLIRHFGTYREVYLYASSIILILHIFVVAHIMVFVYLKQKEIIVIWTKLNTLCNNFDHFGVSVDFKNIKNFTDFVLFITYFLIFCYCCTDTYFWDDGYIFWYIFLVYCSLICTAIECKMIVTLYIILKLKNYFNSLLAKLQLLFYTDKKLKIFLKDLMILHDELFTVGKNVNSAFKLVFLRILLTWFIFTSTIFSLCYFPITHFDDLIYNVDCILWTVSGFLNITLIIMCCEAVKKEVCYDFFC